MCVCVCVCVCVCDCTDFSYYFNKIPASERTHHVFETNRFSVARTENTVKKWASVDSLRRLWYSLRHHIQATSVVLFGRCWHSVLAKEKAVVGIWKIQRQGGSNHVPTVWSSIWPIVPVLTRSPRWFNQSSTNTSPSTGHSSTWRLNYSGIYRRDNR